MFSVIASHHEPGLSDVYVRTWDIEAQNNIIENKTEMGWCLTDASDAYYDIAGGKVYTRRLRFRPKG